jgi:hypothetical protein
MKFICANCKGFSKFSEPAEAILLDDGQVLSCEHCKKETVIDLNPPGFRTQLYNLYTASRRLKADGEETKLTLPRAYKVGDLEIGVEPWRGNWSLYMKTAKETMWFRDPSPNEQLARARAAVLADMIRAADKRPKKGEE